MRAKADRDYGNLKETERVFDAVKRQGTQVKDYSLRELVSVYWRTDAETSKHRLATICIGQNKSYVHGPELARKIDELVDDGDEHGVLPRRLVTVTGQFRTHAVRIDTRRVNYESLRDHVAEVTIHGRTALIDLEELIKATRYA